MFYFALSENAFSERHSSTAPKARQRSLIADRGIYYLTSLISAAFVKLPLNSRLARAELLRGHLNITVPMILWLPQAASLGRSAISRFTKGHLRRFQMAGRCQQRMSDANP
jgi:hypothetical protein